MSENLEYGMTERLSVKGPRKVYIAITIALIFSLLAWFVGTFLNFYLAGTQYLLRELFTISLIVAVFSLLNVIFLFVAGAIILSRIGHFGNQHRRIIITAALLMILSSVSMILTFLFPILMVYVGTNPLLFDFVYNAANGVWSFITGIVSLFLFSVALFRGSRVTVALAAFVIGLISVSVNIIVSYFYTVGRTVTVIGYETTYTVNPLASQIASSHSAVILSILPILLLLAVFSTVISRKKRYKTTYT